MNIDFKKLENILPPNLPHNILDVWLKLTTVEEPDPEIFNDSIEILNSQLLNLHNQAKVFSLYILAICYKAIGNTFMFKDCLDDIKNVTLHRNIEERNEDMLSNAPLFMNPIGISYYLLNGSPARRCREKELDNYKQKILHINIKSICQQ